MNKMISLSEEEVKELEAVEHEMEQECNDSLVEDGVVKETIPSYLRAIGGFKVLTKDEEIALFKRLESGDLSAREQIINHNLKLVVKVAKKYAPKCKSLDLMDLIMEGNIGLMRAIETFEYRKGYKFSTYALWWVRQSITRGIDCTDAMVTLPVHVQEKIFRIKKELGKQEALNCGRLPAEQVQQVVDSLTTSNEQRRYTTRAMDLSNVASLDGSIVNDDGEDSIDRYSLIADESERVEDVVAREFLREDLLDILSNPPFSEKEKEVIEKRFGFNGPVLTLEEIGKEMGVTRERIRQIEAKAIKKLRVGSCKVRLAGYQHA